MPVVDASLVVELVSPAADPSAAVAHLFESWAGTGDELHSPTMLRLEVMNALLTGVRRERWDGAAADAAFRFAASLPVEEHGDDRDRSRAWELARRYDNYPIYDMLYVALAERLGQQLVTVDDKLRRRLAHLGWVLGPGEALDRATRR